ncbi:MAG: hypothetical protein J0M20_04815 [Burkholderiales bacterium]|nr:hypothetical protein [Burkholderiales bacterium]
MKHAKKPPLDPAQLRAYIFTVPKAGTYLMDAFLSQLGLNSTGWHVSLNNYLDTGKHDATTNKTTPSATSVARNYLQTFRQVPAGSHAIGHFNPLFVPPAVLNANQYHIVAVRRHPREVLVSEFIDFRHRRSDVRFVSEQTVPDHGEAFEVYMREHAPVIRSICLNYLLLQENCRSLLYRQVMGRDPAIFIDFKQFIDDKRGPEIAQRIAGFLHRSLTPEEVQQRWRAALDADNKTKSDDVKLPYARDTLWTPKAMQRYQDLGFPEIESHLGY